MNSFGTVVWNHFIDGKESARNDFRAHCTQTSYFRTKPEETSLLPF
jgi:hypothetical protein